MAELAQWLADGYAPAFRTACLILRNPSDAEEAVQDAFLRAWRFRDSIEAEGDARPWIYRVVVNACMSKLRQEIPHRDRRADEGELAAWGTSDRTPEEKAVRTGLADEMASALAELPPHIRVPIVLRYYAQLSEKEIAVAVRRRPGTVKSRLHEGRRLLAEHAGLRAWAGLETVTVAAPTVVGSAPLPPPLSGEAQR